MSGGVEGGRDHTRLTMGAILNNKLTKADIEQYKAEKREQKLLRDERKLEIKQKKAETKKQRTLDKTKKAELKQQAKLEKQERKKLDATIKAEAKVQKKLAEAMLKALKKAGPLSSLVGKNVNLGKNLGMKVEVRSDPVQSLIKAKGLVQTLKAPNSPLTAEIANSNGPEKSMSPGAAALADEIKGILDNSKDTYTQLLAKDPKLAEEFMTSMKELTEQIDKTTVKDLKETFSTFRPNPKDPKDTVQQKINDFTGSFLRSNYIGSGVMSKMKHPMSEKIQQTTLTALADVNKNAKLASLFSAGLNGVEKGDVLSKSSWTNTEIGGKKIDEVLTDDLKKAGVEAYKGMVDKLLDPANLSDDMIKTMGKRYHAIYDSVVAGLKDSGMPQKEIEANAKSIAHASIVNEISLRVLVPELCLIAPPKGEGEAATKKMALAMSKGLQKQINLLSGKPDLTGGEIKELEPKMKSGDKVFLIDHMIDGTLGMVNDKLSAIVDKCVSS